MQKSQNGRFHLVSDLDREHLKLIVIAIPAIGGVPDKTWREFSDSDYGSPRNGYLYQQLHDLARVYLYSFPSNWSAMSVADLSKRLLDCFSEAEPSQILGLTDHVDLHLAAYSTGGLVLKKALVDASRSSDSKCRQFISRCYSIAFFGVPHHHDSLVPSIEYPRLTNIFPSGVVSLEICVPNYPESGDRDQLHLQFLEEMEENKQNFRKIWTFTEAWTVSTDDDSLQFIVPPYSATLAFEGWVIPCEEIVQVQSYHTGLSYFGIDRTAHDEYMRSLRDFTDEHNSRIQVFVLPDFKSSPSSLHELVKYGLKDFTKSKSRKVSTVKSQSDEPIIWIHMPSSNIEVERCLFQLTAQPFRVKYASSAGFQSYWDDLSLTSSDGPNVDNLGISLPYLNYGIGKPRHPFSRRTLDGYGHPNSADPAHADENQVIFKHKPTNEKLLMVDQLWCWHNNNDTVLTAFPGGGMEADLYDHIKKLAYLGYRSQFSKAPGFSHVIISRAVSILLETASKRDSDLDVFKIFPGYFGKFSRNMMGNIQDFIKSHDRSTHRGYRRNRVAHDDHNAELFHGYMEMLDVEDETKILLKLFREQLEIMRPLCALPIGAAEGPSQTHRRTAISEGIQKVNTYITEAQLIIDACEFEREIYKTLFDMKTAQASLDEAYYAHRSNKTLMVFTIVTVVFSPLSFFTSFWGMNAQEWSGDATNPSLKTILPITVLVSLLLICLALFLAFENIRDFVPVLSRKIRLLAAVKRWNEENDEEKLFEDGS